MTAWIFRSALEMADALAAGEVTSLELVEESLARIEKYDGVVHAFITVDAQGARETAQEVDELRAAGVEVHPLAGVPIAIKDNIVTRDLDTTCASAIMGRWKPPYDATVVRKIKEAKLPIIGKTNLDEFAMGSSTEHSAFGPTHNPLALDRIPGGSGGGSAAAVASYMVPLALGSDTGGSIRQPGAFTGTIGAKPTYGAVSRYGLIALASSLDQIGPAARSVRDAAALQELISGPDPLDSTSIPDWDSGLEEAITQRLAEGGQGLRVGIVEQLMGEGYQHAVSVAFDETVERLREAGAEIVSVSCPSFDYAFAAYYLIMPAEASSNLARFDGMRFGERVVPEVPNPTAADVMAATREAGFGFEVKRRIILGTHVLSSGFYDAYYGAAQKVRTLIMRDLDRAFQQADVLLSPSTPTTAFPLGERVDDPMAMYLNDVATIPANLAGVPAMSVPSGQDADGLPTAVQVVAPAGADATMYGVGALVESLMRDKVVVLPQEIQDMSAPVVEAEG